MARKTASAPAPVDVDDLLDGMATGNDTKKGKPKTYTVEIDDKKLVKKLVLWKTSKDTEVSAAADRVSVEGDISPVAVGLLKDEIIKSGRTQASITLAFVHGENDERHEINITANKNQWTPIKDTDLPALQKIFGEEFNTYFESNRVISMTQEVSKDPQVIKDILEKVFAGDKDKFAKYFSVKKTYAPKPVLGESQYVDKAATRLIEAAKEEGVLTQFKPAFSLKA